MKLPINGCSMDSDVHYDLQRAVEAICSALAKVPHGSDQENSLLGEMARLKNMLEWDWSVKQ